MDLNRADYKRLGNYIREVDVRNRDLKVTKLLGVSISKEFMPSIANTIGTDMSSYKVVEPRQFVYIADTSRRGDKIAIALLEEDNKIIVSSIYTVFEVKDKQELLPEYLMMWFRRPEFDHYARFKSHGSAREIFSWEEMCDVELPVPSIVQQQKIVSEYEAVTRRIRLNERIIAKLEETAQALYRKMFVDGIDKKNLPKGWRMGTIGEFCKEIKSGGTPSRSNIKFWNSPQYRWLKSGEVTNNIIFDTEEYISEDALNGSSAKIIPEGAVVMAMYGATASQVAYLACQTTTNQACCNMITNSFEEAAYLYFHCIFKQGDIKRLANGGAQENLSQELICAQPIIMCNNIKDICRFAILLRTKIAYAKEIGKLKQLLSMYLSKLINS